MNDFGYFASLMDNFQKVNDTQSENIKKAASLMADAIECELKRAFTQKYV